VCAACLCRERRGEEREREREREREPLDATCLSKSTYPTNCRRSFQDIYDRVVIDSKPREDEERAPAVHGERVECGALDERQRCVAVEVFGVHVGGFRKKELDDVLMAMASSFM